MGATCQFFYWWHVTYFWHFWGFEWVKFECHVSLIGLDMCHDDLTLYGTHLEWKEPKGSWNTPPWDLASLSSGATNPFNSGRGPQGPKTYNPSPLSTISSSFELHLPKVLKGGSSHAPWWLWVDFRGFGLLHHLEMGGLPYVHCLHYYGLIWSWIDLIFVFCAWKCFNIIWVTLVLLSTWFDPLMSKVNFGPWFGFMDVDFASWALIWLHKLAKPSGVCSIDPACGIFF